MAGHYAAEGPARRGRPFRSQILLPVPTCGRDDRDMGTLRRHTATGRDALLLTADLLHRVRAGDRRAGTWEAADPQWWWRKPRETDDLPQTFLLDEGGPLATARLTAWTDTWALDVIRVDAAGSGWRELADTALERARASRAGAVEALIRADDTDVREWLAERGLVQTADRDATGWLAAADRPAVPELPAGYRLADRGSRPDGEHPMAARSGPQVERRLRELPLYNPAHDLAIVAPDGSVAGYAMFWHDPATLVGLVEPVRVEDEHSGKGLAYAMVAAGLDRLVAAGSTLLKISWGSERAGDVYTRLGFTEPAPSVFYRWDRPATLTR